MAKNNLNPVLSKKRGDMWKIPVIKNAWKKAFRCNIINSNDFNSPDFTSKLGMFLNELAYERDVDIKDVNDIVRVILDHCEIKDTFREPDPTRYIACSVRILHRAINDTFSRNNKRNKRYRLPLSSLDVQNSMTKSRIQDPYPIFCSKKAQMMPDGCSFSHQCPMEGSPRPTECQAIYSVYNNL